MKAWKALLILLLAAALVFALPGCKRADAGYADVVDGAGSDLSAPPEEERKDIHIGVTMPTDDEFSANYLRIFTAYAEKNGARVTAVSADNDAEEQIRQVEELIGAGCHVIYCRAVDSDRLACAAEYACEMGVPFIGAEFDVNSDTCTSHLRLDENVYGFVQGLCVTYLLERDPELTIRAGHLWVCRSWAQEQQRWDGFCEATAEYLETGRLVILDEADTLNDATNAVATAENWLSEYPEMNCIVANNDHLAYATGRALAERGVDMTAFYVLGVEGTADGLQGVKEGVLYATAKILDDKERIEFFCSIAIEAALGHAVKKEYAWSGEGAVVTATNVEEYLAAVGIQENR